MIDPAAVLVRCSAAGPRGA